MIVWKRDGLLAPYVPEDVAKYYPRDHRDPDGMFASFRATLSVIAYNTNLVKPEEAPKSFADLLDPKWAGKIVKAHPSYSGTIMTATFQITRDLGWEYFEKLAKQRIMQVQSATDPPKKLGLGERAVMADGSEYIVFQMMDQGQPVTPIYATEGTPLVIGPNAVFKAAPNPNAARLFQSYCFSLECQQLIVDHGGLRSFHRQVKERSGHKALKDIKLMQEDAAGVEKQSDEIKKRYAQLFKV
jgi:iron(III) transport system substrate-binding protein